LEDDADVKATKKCNKFWKYFKFLLTKIPSWNILKNGEYIEVRNHTNDTIKSYNCKFNDLFTGKPSLLMFVQIVEQECHNQAEGICNIQLIRRHLNSYNDIMLPPICSNMVFKANEEKKAAASFKKKVKKNT
jgi:hypothetical protein